MFSVLGSTPFSCTACMQVIVVGKYDHYTPFLYCELKYIFMLFDVKHLYSAKSTAYILKRFTGIIQSKQT